MLIKQRPVPAISLHLPDVPAVLKRIYAARGISDASQLDKQLQTLLPFNSLKGIEAACLRLETALRLQQRILIIGDFDADGATSTALAISALRSFGVQTVEYLVPNRFEFGYGLTPAIVDVAFQWKPDLIITVDNGIASFDGVARANELGIDVLITDHHLPAETIPDACAIVNPNQEGCAFPSKSIAGVGVIFYVMLALRRHLHTAEWFKTNNIAEPNMASFLDLVALGTVADVVGLDQNNRIMVNQGMARIRQGLCREGIKALIEVSGRDGSRLRESDLGFAIAPRLNAAGRLDDMALGIECLISSDPQQARNYCQQLDELNQERKQIELEMKEQAMIALDKLSLNTNQMPIALCLFDKTWHQGVIGILAGRMKERYHRPVIAFAAAGENDEELKGSARSVPDLNIRDILAAIDKDHPGLITKFGGHAMAAGLSMPRASLERFRDALAVEVGKHLDASQCKGELLTDGPLQPDEFNLATAELLQQAGPWGQQFAEPVFDNVFELLDQRLVGKSHLKMTLVSNKGGEPIDAIAFNVDLKAWPNHRAKYLHVAYKLDINFFQGRSRLQLLVQAMNCVENDVAF
ncbi:MAG: single-stranded-DNA-specific exonuclease RecJ [Legionella sp.]